MDPRLERIRVEPLDSIVTRNLAPREAALRLVAGFGALALLLATIGIYGIVAFRAAERSREMAIRMALGASGAHVRGLVFGYAVRMAALGGALGVAGFAVVLPLLKSQVYGVRAADPSASPPTWRSSAPPRFGTGRSPRPSLRRAVRDVPHPSSC